MFDMGLDMSASWSFFCVAFEYFGLLEIYLLAGFEIFRVMDVYLSQVWIIHCMQ